MHMMIQRDSMMENMILQGRYEVRKAIHTTRVERDYEVYDREEKKEYRVKEFYPSNYCSRGADGQTVIVRGVRNQSVFEQSKEWFAQAYRQIAASTKTKGFPEAVRLFSENNTVYVILEKSVMPAENCLMPKVCPSYAQLWKPYCKCSHRRDICLKFPKKA